jgi:hypothetical protein
VGRDGIRTLRRIIGALPTRVVEEKLATTEGSDDLLEAHRCGAYLFNLGPVHRPVGVAAETARQEPVPTPR